MGFDAVHGKCHIIECEKCSEDSTFIFPPGGVTLLFGVGLPFVIVLVSYGLVYRTLSQAAIDAETRIQRRAVMILTSCYIVFILPIGIIEWLPGTILNRAFISVCVYCLYWQVYVVNFFVYIFFYRRIRKGITLMMRDVLEIAGLKTRTPNYTFELEPTDTECAAIQKLDQ